MENLITSMKDFIAATFDGMSSMVIALAFVLFVAFLVLIIYFFRIHIAYRMAVNRHRDPLGWALLSFFFSPILTWIILLIAGDRNN